MFLAIIIPPAKKDKVVAAPVSYTHLDVYKRQARYLLMSCAMGQRLKPGLSFGHRLLMGYDITDELFGIAIARPGYLEPFYTYGAMLTAIPCWATGTACGIIAGNIMPAPVSYTHLDVYKRQLQIPLSGGTVQHTGLAETTSADTASLNLQYHAVLGCLDKRNHRFLRVTGSGDVKHQLLLHLLWCFRTEGDHCLLYTSRCV